MIPLSFFSAFVTPPKGWLMGLFAGYFDDSGHEYDPNALSCSLGGYIGTVENWKYFETEWQKVLNDHDVPYLHMKELSCFRGPFKKYEDSLNERDSLLKSLIKVIKDSEIIGFASTIYLDIFNKLNKRKNKYAAYAINMYSCLWCISNKWPNIVVEIIFDKTEKFDTKKNKAESYAKRNEYYYKRYKYISAHRLNENLSFIDVLPLQAADLLAYEIAKEAKTRIELIQGTYKRLGFSINEINYGLRRKSMQGLLNNTKINDNFEWPTIQLGCLMKGGGYLIYDNEIKIKLPD